MKTQRELPSFVYFFKSFLSNELASFVLILKLRRGITFEKHRMDQAISYDVKRGDGLIFCCIPVIFSILSIHWVRAYV